MPGRGRRGARQRRRVRVAFPGLDRAALKIAPLTARTIVLLRLVYGVASSREPAVEPVRAGACYSPCLPLSAQPLIECIARLRCINVGGHVCAPHESLC